MGKREEKKARETEENIALNAAINRVYQKYGTNLAAFYRDVRDGLAKSEQTTDSHTSAK
jgi:hypothetical protein